jgi:hypothetical protein
MQKPLDPQTPSFHDVMKLRRQDIVAEDASYPTREVVLAQVVFQFRRGESSDHTDELTKCLRAQRMLAVDDEDKSAVVRHGDVEKLEPIKQCATRLPFDRLSDIPRGFECRPSISRRPKPSKCWFRHRRRRLVRSFNLPGDSHAVMADERRAELPVDYYAIRFGSRRHPDGIGNWRGTVEHLWRASERIAFGFSDPDSLCPPVMHCPAHGGLGIVPFIIVVSWQI